MIKRIGIVLALLLALALPAATNVQATAPAAGVVAPQLPGSYVCDRMCMTLSWRDYDLCMSSTRNVVTGVCDERQQAFLARCVRECNEQYGDILP